jgi:hypothetical protein
MSIQNKKSRAATNQPANSPAAITVAALQRDFAVLRIANSPQSLKVYEMQRGVFRKIR